MKKIIILILMVLMIPFAVADTCSFLDSDGDCLTTAQELADVQDLSNSIPINCVWSDCTKTLDGDGNGIINNKDVTIINKILSSQPVTISGAPSVVNMELINNNQQVKFTVTDSDGTPRVDIGIDYEVIEDPATYSGTAYTDSNGEIILDMPSELLTQNTTGRVWFDADTTKQIPYTESTLPYNPPVFCYALSKCSDGLDNDGDGVSDVADPGCWNNGAYGISDNDETNNGVFQCNDGLDNDGDGKTDWPADNDCKSVVDNDETTTGIFQCNDDLDNDGDSYVDYLDFSCYDNGFYNPNRDENSLVPECSDGIDNDLDGGIDYLDLGCYINGFYNPNEDELDPQCSDGIDNDLDGKADIDDAGCYNELGVYVPSDNDEVSNGITQCSDGVDNDLDGNIDWGFDSDCVDVLDDDESTPLPQCSDSIDNDGDGFIDATDAGCYDSFGAYGISDNDETNNGGFQCNDGVDNDGDSFIDWGADSDCLSTIGDDESGGPSEFGSDANTIALYHFDELSGGSVADSSGNNLDGSATGTTIVNGMFGKARSFNGASDYVEITSSSLFDITGDLTLEAYINWIGPNNAEIVGKTGSGGSSYRLVIDVSKLYLYVWNGGVASVCGTVNNVPVGQLVHVAGTYDASTQTMQIFIDGVLENTCSGPSSMDLSTTNIRIGARSFTPIDDLMNGVIDEVRISDIVRY